VIVGIIATVCLFVWHPYHRYYLSAGSFIVIMIVMVVLLAVFLKFGK